MGKPMKTYLTERFHRALEKVLSIHNGKAYGRDGQLAPRRICLLQTQRDRSSFYVLAFGQLAQMGYRLEGPEGLNEKHVHALAKRWLGEGIAARTLHTRMSMLRVLVGWIGKPGMVKDNELYYPEGRLKRTDVATRNRAWSANGVKPDEIIEQAFCLDERFGLMLSFQYQFGLRVVETLTLCPASASTSEGEMLFVIGGTNRLKRMVPIKTIEQQQLITRAKNCIGGSGSKTPKKLHWRGMTVAQARSKFHRLVRRLGLTQEGLGVSNGPDPLHPRRHRNL